MKVSKTLIGFLIAGIIAAATAIVLYNKPHKNVSEMTADHHLSASELVQAFEEREEAANAIYLNQVVEVTGTIESFANDNKDVIVVLSSSGSLGSVRCVMTSKSLNPDLHVKDPLTIKGICTGYLLDVILVRCVIV